MKITLTSKNTNARSYEYYLRRRYKSKASFEKLAKVAIMREVSSEAAQELKELEVIE